MKVGDIIRRAFQKAGIKPAESTLEANELEDGLDTLRDMLNAWNAAGKLIGAQTPEDVNEELRVPNYALGAIKANLAIMLAGEYNLPITAVLAGEAEMMSRDLATAQNSRDSLDVLLPPTLPIGSGNSTQYVSDDIDFFPEQPLKNF